MLVYYALVGVREHTSVHVTLAESTTLYGTQFDLHSCGGVKTSGLMHCSKFFLPPLDLYMSTPPRSCCFLDFESCCSLDF